MDTLKEMVSVLSVLTKIAVETDCAPIIVQIGRENDEPNDEVFIKGAPPAVIQTLVENGFLCFMESEGIRIMFPLKRNGGEDA